MDSDAEGANSSFWRGKAVLVTGGCGFIGSHLVEALLRHGAKVRVLDLYTAKSDRNHLSQIEDPALDVLLGDIADPFFTIRAARDVNVIFHLAALIGIPYSYHAPAHYVRTNIEGTLAVLEAARIARVDRLVHTSTSEVFGTAQYQPINETHPIVPQSPYAATKAAADHLAVSYFRSYNLPVVICRPFNTYGPRQSLRAVLPTILSQLLFSDQVRVGSVTPVRDMNYVSDTVQGFLLIGSVPGVEGESFNIGSGEGRSIREMIDVCQRIVDVKKDVEIDNERIRPVGSEVELLICDNTKATQWLGYTPEVPFNIGVTHLRDYLLDHSPIEPSRYHI